MLSYKPNFQENVDEDYSLVILFISSSFSAQSTYLGTYLPTHLLIMRRII